MSGAPRVRIVVLNYDGGDMTLRCLEAVRAIDYPRDALQVTVVDNASIDGIAPRIRKEMPWVELIENPRNLGFAGGCNVALRDLDGFDYVALLNNDALPDPGWLQPLVDALERDPSLGAANSKILFAPSFVSLVIDAPESADASALGVKITGLAVDGTEVWDNTQFAVGCSAVETRGSGATQLCWTTAHAEVRVPVGTGAPLPGALEVELSAKEAKTVTLSVGDHAVDVDVGPSAAWFTLPIEGRAFDVVNNVGSRLVIGGYGGDRGFLERDDGQFEDEEEIFAWCGCSVLLSTRYLREVGVFDERYFMYYEDTDLSWRGRLAGWRYVYVPTSRVRHLHAASSREGSAMFGHYVERNRFLTLARNGPPQVLVNAATVFLRDSLVIARRDGLRSIGRGTGPNTALALRRVRAFAAFVKLLPATLGDRRRQHASVSSRRSLFDRWAVPR